MEDGFGAGDVGNETADSIAVDPDGGGFGADDVGKFEAVGLEERLLKEGQGDFEADEFEVCGWGEAAFAELVDVEGELGLDVCVGIFGVVDYGAVLLLELGELDGNGVVDGETVAYGVADVVRERADGEGELVGGG
jgi:hypothetical protein